LCRTTRRARPSPTKRCVPSCSPVALPLRQAPFSRQLPSRAHAVGTAVCV
jgi:hypothetical protein